MENDAFINAGFVQFNPKLGNLHENINRITHLLEQANEVDLIVLPELANSGYNFDSKQQAMELAEYIGKSVYIDFLISQANQHNLLIVSGFNERENDTLFNSAVLIGRDGLIGKYRKLHLFMNERDIFEPGNLGLPVFDVGNLRIGMLVCFDWIFPEAWRILALKGAEVICHPSNLVLPYAQQAVPVQGMMNRTFNITANRIGTEREISFTGQSIISDPNGITLRKASADEEEIIVEKLDLSLARNKMITPRNHIFNDRLPTEYSFLCE